MGKLIRNGNPSLTVQSKSANKIFEELVVKILSEIKNCEEKHLIKLEIQQKLAKLKYHKLRQYQLGDRVFSPAVEANEKYFRRWSVTQSTPPLPQ